MYKIKSLYWWNKVPNFGDAISPVIVSYLLGKELPPSQEGDENVLLAVGSILHHSSKFKNPIVWGSGCDPNRYGKPKGDATYLAVRGPKTKEYLGLGPLPLGDPALLMPKIFPIKPNPVEDVGIVIHHSTAKRRMRDLLFDPYRTGYRIIDPRKEWRQVITEICRSKFVFCQSLHGAIIAQAYGVPWAWWRGLYGHFVGFKWEDFFGSIHVQPRSFSLCRRKAAEKWAARIKPKMPNSNDLIDALISNVEVMS